MVMRPVGLALALASFVAVAPFAQPQPLADAINAPPPVALVRDNHQVLLSFEDDFDELNLERNEALGWTLHFAHGPPGGLDERTLRNNGELQIYIDPAHPWRARARAPETISVHKGLLHLRAFRLPERARDQVWGYEYVSGMVSSHRLFQQTYGYFEIRARLPNGRGFWPAFWLLPQSGRWPPELDALEALGHDTHAYYASYHSRTGDQRSARSARIATEDLSAGFHDYGVLWTPVELVWFFDGSEVARQPTPTDMHEPMYMLLNLAVGGNWPGAPDLLSAFPSDFIIDHVRAYRLTQAGSASQ